MKKFLFVSAACLLFTSLLFTQTREEALEDYLSELDLPDSTLKELLKQQPELDSLLGGKFYNDSLKIYVVPPSNSFNLQGQYRVYNMPEVSMEDDYFPKMPEYHADSSIAYKMPEVKYPGLIRDKSKILGYPKENKRDK